MIKKNLKVLIVTSLIILLPIVAGVILWDRLPEQMPNHWNVAGEIDGWSSKWFSVFGMPLIMLAFQWICALGTGSDPKKENHHDKVVHLVLWIIPVISTVLHAIVYAVALGGAVRVEMVMPVMVGLVLAVVGNYLPKCKQNYTIGIKLPWTLNDEENWNKTHRFAGKLWVAGGVLIAATSILGNVLIFLGVTLIMAFVPMIYSYLLYRKK